MYEPKWDWFRAIVFRGEDEVYLQSRDSRPLDRYFPELHAVLLERLPKNTVVDGEIVIATARGLDFDALQLRLHPAASRVEKLAGQTPASFIAFDVLATAGRSLMDAQQGERRAALGNLLRDVQAQSGPYLPGKRAMIKVKHTRTADCVVAGFRWHKSGKDAVGSLLLGLYDDSGVLQHVGVTSNLRLDTLLILRLRRSRREPPGRCLAAIELQFTAGCALGIVYLDCHLGPCRAQLQGRRKITYVLRGIGNQHAREVAGIIHHHAHRIARGRCPIQHDHGATIVEKADAAAFVALGIVERQTHRCGDALAGFTIPRRSGCFAEDQPVGSVRA
jgi:hypothetical protein